MSELDKIRGRLKALENWQPYDAKTTRELQGEIERMAIIDITFLLDKIDADAKIIADGLGTFTKWLGECPTCGVQPNFGEEINHWDTCKYNEWLKAVAQNE